MFAKWGAPYSRSLPLCGEVSTVRQISLVSTPIPKNHGKWWICLASAVLLTLLTSGAQAVAEEDPAVPSVTAVPPPTPAGQMSVANSLEHDGLTRFFDYYLPDALPEGPRPLVFIMHGGTQDSTETLAGALGWLLNIADREGFIVVAPNGVDTGSGETGPSGSFNWNDCRRTTVVDTAPVEADDVGFVSALIDWVDERFEIDRDRVYATGPSNGGNITQRLGLELSDEIAAGAALISPHFHASEECATRPARPTSMLILRSTNDPLVLYTGQPLGREPYLGGTATRDAWREFAGATGEPRAVNQFPDRDPTDTSVVRAEFYDGLHGTEIAYYEVLGGGHVTPAIRSRLGVLGEAVVGRQNHDVEAAEEIWRFFARHTRLEGTSAQHLPVRPA